MPRFILPLLLAVIGLILFGQGAYIHAKALVAQVLLERAFDKTIATGQETKPWSWADTWPVARLEFPRLGRGTVVLAGSSGQALAFGPAGRHDLPGRIPVRQLFPQREEHARDVDVDRAVVHAGSAEGLPQAEVLGPVDARQKRGHHRPDGSGVGKPVCVASDLAVDRAGVQAGRAADAAEHLAELRVGQNPAAAVVYDDQVKLVGAIRIPGPAGAAGW